MKEKIAYAQGGAFVRDDPDKALTLQEIALALYYSWDTPSQMEPSLEATVFWIARLQPYGCNVAEVEVDPDTGEVDVLRYVLVTDVGVIGNSMVLEGQLPGEARSPSASAKRCLKSLATTTKAAR